MTAQKTNLPVVDSSTERMNGTLFASMQEQATQIQKVNARLEAAKPASQVVNNP